MLINFGPIKMIMITKQTSPMVNWSKSPSSIFSLGMISRFSSKLNTTNLKFLQEKQTHLYAAWKVSLVFWFPKLEYKRYSGETIHRQNRLQIKKLETAVSMARLNSENCGPWPNIALFSLATRVLPAFPNFGQANSSASCRLNFDALPNS